MHDHFSHRYNKNSYKFLFFLRIPEINGEINQKEEKNIKNSISSNLRQNKKNTSTSPLETKRTNFAKHYLQNLNRIIKMVNHEKRREISETRRRTLLNPAFISIS